MPPAAPTDSGSSSSASPPGPTFTALYTRLLTGELANDLDAVRHASDFHAGSVGVLVHALQQGAATFTDAERRRLVVAAGPGDAGVRGKEEEKKGAGR